MPTATFLGLDSGPDRSLARDVSTPEGRGRQVAARRKRRSEQELRSVALLTLGFAGLAAALAPSVSELHRIGQQPGAAVTSLAALDACAGLVLAIRWLRVARDALAPALDAEEEPALARLARGGLGAVLSAACLVVAALLGLFFLV